MSFTLIFDLGTFFIITIWIFKALMKRKIGSIFFLSIMLYVFYIVPIGLDWLYEMADYSYSGWWGFIVPRQDWMTNVLYDLLFISTFYNLLKNNKKYDSKLIGKKNNPSNETLYLIIISLVPSVAVILLLHQPAMLFAFQWRELDLFPTTGSYATIEKLSYLAVSSAVLLLFSKTRFNLLLKLFAIALLFINICIQGKRAIMFYAIINIIIVLYIKFRNANLSYKQYLLTGIACLSVFALFFIIMVNMTISVKLDRGYDPNNTSAMYTTTRIDFLRDDRVRLAIYSRLHPEEVEVLKYPTQTIWSDIFSFIPLNYIASASDMHLYSYQTYFTHALEHKAKNVKIDVENHSYMTVSIVSEIISNFGLLLAFIILPFICKWIAKKAEEYPYPLNALILCIFASLNMFDFTYMAYYIEATVILCWIYKKSTKRRIV